MYFFFFFLLKANKNRFECGGFDQRCVLPWLPTEFIFICDQNYYNELQQPQTPLLNNTEAWRRTRRGGEVRRILVAHSSALCHPADICYICMAAGDPWIKRLQEYCHISFNNIIILWGKRCFIPDALQKLGIQFPLTLSLSASHLPPSSLSLSPSSSLLLPFKLSLFCCDAF